jgi:hypothetical protein
LKFAATCFQANIKEIETKSKDAPKMFKGTATALEALAEYLLKRGSLTISSVE